MTGLAQKLLLDMALWFSAALLAYAFRKPSLIDLGIPLEVWAYAVMSAAVLGLLSLRYHLPHQSWRRVEQREVPHADATP